MAVNIRSTTWRPAATGKIAIRWNSVWNVGSYCKIKDAGVWKDSGYLGPPNPPSTPAVYDWSYTNLRVYWGYASGGPPIDYYEVQLLNEGGGLLASENSTDNISPSWGVSQNTRYRVRVRSHSPSGLTSAWMEAGAGARPYIGIASVPIYGNVEHIDPWVGQVNEYGHRDGVIGPIVPASVHVSSVHWQLQTTFGGDWISHPTFPQQQCWIVANGVQQSGYGAMAWPNPLDGWDSFDFWGNGDKTGYVCRGTVWSTLPFGGNRIGGFVTVFGENHYLVYEQTGSTTATPNGYW